MKDIEELFPDWAGSDTHDAGLLVTSLYDELRALANNDLTQERVNHTLQPTALVHEAFVRQAGNRKVDRKDRHHFFATAAAVMRRVLIDRERQNLSSKLWLIFGGLRAEELAVSKRTISTEWQMVRAWLYGRFRQAGIQ